MKTNKRARAQATRWKARKDRKKKISESHAGTAKTIVDCMLSVGKRGNPRDFVLVSGASITDFWGVVPIPIALDTRVMLVYKGKLEEVIVERLAEKVEGVEGLAVSVADVFWNKATQRRRNRSPRKAKRHVNESKLRMEDRLHTGPRPEGDRRDDGRDTAEGGVHGVTDETPSAL